MFDPERIGSRMGTGTPVATAAPPPAVAPPPPSVAATRPAPNTQHPVNRQPLPSGGQLYGGYTAEQLTANPSLVSRLGPGAAARWAARASAAPAPTGPPTEAPGAAPTPGAPVGSFVPMGPGGPQTSNWTGVEGPGNGGMPGGGGQWAPGQPPPGGPPQGGPGGPNQFTDPMQMFMAAIPGMRLNTSKQIADAMAAAGGTGNRWGTSAQRTAGQIGAEAGMQENALLQNLLSNYSNNQENRALQANQQAIQLGGLQDQMAQNRINTESGLGQWEQGRQDQFSNTAFQDWSQNRLGWLGPMLQFAGGQGAGSPAQPGQIYQTTTPAQPGAADWLTVIANLFK